MTIIMYPSSWFWTLWGATRVGLTQEDGLVAWYLVFFWCLVFAKRRDGLIKYCTLARFGCFLFLISDSWINWFQCNEEAGKVVGEHPLNFEYVVLPFALPPWSDNKRCLPTGKAMSFHIPWGTISWGIVDDTVHGQAAACQQSMILIGPLACIIRRKMTFAMLSLMVL